MTATTAIFLLSGGLRWGGRPVSLLLGTTIGSALIASLAIFTMVWRGSSILGRSRAAVLSAALIAPLALLAWKMFYSSRFAHGIDEWPAYPGLRCLGLTLAMSTLPLLALLHVREGTDPAHPHVTGFGLGAATGLGAAVLVDMWCPVANACHLLLGHVLPIALLALAGLSLGGRIYRPQKYVLHRRSIEGGRPT